MARLALVTALLLAACGPSASELAPSLADTGVSLAQNVGATLAIVELDPATTGRNTVRVLLRDAEGKHLTGQGSRVSLLRAGRELGAVPLDRPGERRTLDVPEAAAYDLRVTLATGGSMTFRVEFPAKPADPQLLAKLDQAMNALRGLREAQTLTSGTFVYTFHYDYQAPDRVRFTFITPDGLLHETVIVGARRYDRDGPEAWIESDLVTASVVPNFTYAADAHRVRVLGHESLDGSDAVQVALVEGAPPLERYYRLWIE